MSNKHFINPVLLVCILFLISSVAVAQPDKTIAVAKGQAAISLIDEGKFEEAILLLEEAKRLDPDNYNYPYELGYIYYAKENYKKAQEVYESLLKYKGISDQVYQMLGNSYDMTGDSLRAIQTYNDGLKLFPKSGALYLERANMYWNKKEYMKALPLYEKGIEVDPSFPSNYYKAARIYCATTETIWGILYGEMFMNIERNSERTREMSELLYKTYEHSITIKSETEASVNFSKMNVIDGSKKITIPFSMLYGLDMTFDLTSVMLGKDKKITIASLSAIRNNFTGRWFQEKRNKDYPNVLFDYQKKLVELGHFEAYNYWLFSEGNTEEFTLWRAVNKTKWEAFIAWYSEHPITIDDTHKLTF